MDQGHNNAPKLLKLIKLWGPITLTLTIIGIGIGSRLVAENKRKQLSFRGPNMGLERVKPKLGGEYYLLHIEGEDEGKHLWKVGVMDEGYYEYFDFVVKLPGKTKLALFREGKQRRGNPFYLDEEVDINDYKKPAGSDRERQTEPVMVVERTTFSNEPVVVAKKTPLPDEPDVTEQTALQYIEEAGRLWNSGDMEGAIKSSEKALAVRLRLYNNDHPLVVDVRNKIKAAKEYMAQSQETNQPTE